MTEIKEIKLSSLEIDIRFLSHKYGIKRHVATEIIKDIVKGNFDSKPFTLVNQKNRG